MIIIKCESDPSIGAMDVDEDTQRYLAGEIQIESDDDNFSDMAIERDGRHTR